MTRRDGGDRRDESDRRRRIGVLVALVPVVLFALSIVFVAVRRPAEERAACVHDHAPEEVRDWWRAARPEEEAVPGTRYVALDDSLGCIRVGLDRAEARSHLERRFRSLGVPGDVVIWEMAEGEAPEPSGDGPEERP